MLDAMGRYFGDYLYVIPFTFDGLDSVIGYLFLQDTWSCMHVEMITDNGLTWETHFVSGCHRTGEERRNILATHSSTIVFEILFPLTNAMEVSMPGAKLMTHLVVVVVEGRYLFVKYYWPAITAYTFNCTVPTKKDLNESFTIVRSFWKMVPSGNSTGKGIKRRPLKSIMPQNSFVEVGPK